METSLSVLRTVRQDDWMMTIVLKDEYLQDSDSPILSEIPQIYNRNEGLAVQGSLLRSDHGSTGFYESRGSGRCVASSPGHQSSVVPRRLADFGLIGGRGGESKG